MWKALTASPDFPEVASEELLLRPVPLLGSNPDFRLLTRTSLTFVKAAFLAGIHCRSQYDRICTLPGTSITEESHT